MTSNSTFHSDVTDDFKKLYKTKEDYDAIIIAGEKSNVKEIKVHSLILRTRSSYFRTAFSSNWAERNDNGHLVLKKPNISALVLEIILKYLYCGTVDIQSQKIEIIFEILTAADELGIQRLINSVQKLLVQNCYKFLKSDPFKMLELITSHNELNDLKKVSLETLNKHCKDILRKDPIKIFNFINNQEASKEMKREEFMIEVWPFRHLLPDNLIEDILRYYLISGSVPHSNAFPIRLGNINIKFDIKIDSVIINKRIALLLTKWIDEKTIVNKHSKKVIYNFNLLFRSSIDGFSSQIFHQKCDNKKSTIVIAKISNSNMLIGGYNPLYWSGNGYKSTTNSFIFSFNDFNDPQSAKLGRVTNSDYAVYCHNNFGPSFGHDLCVPNNSNNWQYHKTSYPNIEVPNSFTISEYEVFQIVKR
ncbi:19326_t:CDS:2 [Gigaspora margarita]|uniref:19326_t:CDS:1 n=1 Tax=Gigaspora margarita TaxID=4874 RepID=A0ABN7V1M0_GIGMA|nr:19326_t:CDS:2 [Gigaspora margarita]